jgi:hypothetical protein
VAAELAAFEDLEIDWLDRLLIWLSSTEGERLATTQLRRGGAVSSGLTPRQSPEAEPNRSHTSEAGAAVEPTGGAPAAPSRQGTRRWRTRTLTSAVNTSTTSCEPSSTSAAEASAASTSADSTRPARPSMCSQQGGAEVHTQSGRIGFRASSSTDPAFTQTI